MLWHPELLRKALQYKSATQRMPGCSTAAGLTMINMTNLTRRYDH